MPTVETRLALVEREIVNTRDDVRELTVAVSELTRMEHQREGAYATLRLAALLLSITVALLVIGQALQWVQRP